MKRLMKLALAATAPRDRSGSGAGRSTSTTTRRTGRTPSSGAFGKAAGGDVTPTPYADTSTYQAAVRAALRTPSAPGIFTWWSGYRMKDLVDAGLVADVSDLWKKYTDAGLYSPSLPRLTPSTARSMASPNLVAYWVVFYNKKVFAENGIELPKTWDDLEAAAATLKAARGHPFGATIEGRWPAFIWFEEFLVRQHPDFYAKLMNGEAKYTDPEVTDSLRELEGAGSTRATSPIRRSPSAPPAATPWRAKFAQGKLAMILVGTWYAATLTASRHVGRRHRRLHHAERERRAWAPAVIFETGPAPDRRELGTESRRAEGRRLLDVGAERSRPGSTLRTSRRSTRT